MRRVFVAVRPPGSIRKRVAAWVNDLRPECAADVRWVNEEKLHFTLLFVGDLEPDKEAELFGFCDRVASDHDSARVELGEPGFFPPRGKARVFWLGCADGPGREALTAVAHELRKSASEVLGLAADSRPYRPHMTLARVGRKPARWPTELSGPAGSFMFEEIVVFESLQDAGRLRYEGLHRSALRQPL